MRKLPHRLSFLGISAIVILLAGCESVTGPSVQNGFDQDGAGDLGQPTLGLSSTIAIGRKIDPVVDVGTVGGDAIARQAARFRSSDARVIVVNGDGTLTVRGLGSAMVTVNLHGLYDSTLVTVVKGWSPTFISVPAPVTVTGINNAGSVVGTTTAGGVLLVGGLETNIPNCLPVAINAQGDVACNIPVDPCPGAANLGTASPGIYRGGSVIPLLPGKHGWDLGINDSSVVLGFVTVCPDTTPAHYGYFIGRPDALLESALPQSFAESNQGIDNATGTLLSNPGIAAIGWISDSLNQLEVWHTDIVSQTGRTPLAILDYNDPNPGPLIGVSDVNNHNEAVGFSGQTHLFWPSLGIGGSQVLPGHCRPDYITDSEQVFGYWPADGACMQDLTGTTTTTLQDMVSQPDASVWTFDWVGSKVSRNGIIAVSATSDQGAYAVALIHTNEEQ